MSTIDSTVETIDIGHGHGQEPAHKQATHMATVTDEKVREFAKLSGDKNPIHLDEEAAGESLFGGRVAHGMFCASFVSAALWQLPGTIVLLNQELEYEAPVRLGDELTARALPVELVSEEPEEIRCRTPVENQDGEVVITGEATIRRA